MGMLGNHSGSVQNLHGNYPENQGSDGKGLIQEAHG